MSDFISREAKFECSEPIICIKNIMDISDTSKRDDECFLSHVDTVIIASAGEVGILSEPSAREILRNFIPDSVWGQDIPFISLGCVSFAAALMYYKKLKADRAIILMLETPSHYNQKLLNASGIGIGGDGFCAQDSSFCVEVTKDCIEPEGVFVIYSEILSKPLGVGGTMGLAAKLVSVCEKILARFPDTKIVSYENTSSWSKQLYNATKICIDKITSKLDTNNWLPSVERDQNHFMSIRSLLDFKYYSACLDESVLIVLTLGAGGRVSVIAFSSKPIQGVSWGHSCDTCFLGKVNIKKWIENNGPTPLYMDSKYFNRPNFFFEWQIGEEAYA